MKNPYETLGLSKSATPDEIKSAYRKLAKQYHPDQNQGDKTAEAKFKEISAAYEILSDPQKRSNFDKFGSADGIFGGGQGQGGFGGFDFGSFGQGFGGFSDIFGDLFQGGFGSFGKKGGQRANRGNDIQLNINLSFKEAALGSKKTVAFSRFEKCHDCNGTGARNGTSVETCSYCQGRGHVKQTSRLGQFGIIENVIPCSACNGSGRMIREKCPSCSAKGAIKRTVNYEVNIPAGIADGQILNISGEGDAAMGSEGISGNLLIGVRVASHPILLRDGDDLLLELPISFTQAILGDRVRIPTVEGQIDFTVPPNTQSGTIHRIKGKGIKKLRRTGNGDLVVKILVEMPDRLDRRTQELIRSLDGVIGDKDYKKKNSYLDKMKRLGD